MLCRLDIVSLMVDLILAMLRDLTLYHGHGEQVSVRVGVYGTGWKALAAEEVTEEAMLA